MPELPDLESLVPRLSAEMVGRTIDAVRTRAPVVWRVAVPGTPESILTGRRIVSLQRRGHFVVFSLEPPLWLVANLMLAGRFAIVPPGPRDEAGLCAVLRLADRELRFLDEMQMGKLYLVERGDAARVPGLATLGIDVLSPELTAERFRALVVRRRDQVRAFLLDKTALASIGNAYADEILFDAGIHPKTFVRALSDDEVKRLYRSVRWVLRAACEEVRRRGARMDEKVRDFLKVRNRKGEPCPRCGTTIRTAGVRGVDAFFCPHCQPATRRSFVDFARLPVRDDPAGSPPRAAPTPSGGSRAGTTRPRR